MMKKILPALVGLALAGGMSLAAADITLFGHIDTSIDATDVDGGSDDINMNCTTCSIGFKGSEDLGNGLKAIFSLDFEYDTTERNSSLTDRDQWLGLGGGFGQVRVGTISTVYKSHGAMIDPLYRTSLQGRTHGLQSSFHSSAGEELQGRATNTVRWDSTDFSGFKLGATYTFDSGGTETDDPFGIGGSYENGGILVFADYIDANGSTSAGNDESAWKVGGKYTMNDFAVMGQYEGISDNNADDTVWHIAGSYTMDSNLIYVAYGNTQSENASGVEIEDQDAWTIAAVHSMSKSTSVYAGYNSQDDSYASDSVDQFSLGMKLKF